MYQKFQPSLCDGKLYSGHVVLRNLSFDERLEIYETLGLESVPSDEVDQRKFGLKVIRAIAKKAKDFVSEVEIQRVSDGHKINSWAEIDHDPDLTGIVVEVCTKILGKIRAGI